MSTSSKPFRQYLWIPVIAVSVILIAISLLPRAFGWIPCGLHDRSMEPAYRKGSLVLARPVAFDDIRAGDVLVFSDPNSSAHFTRVVREVWHTEKQLVTSSASADAPDPMTTAYRCVVGRVEYSLPLLGYPAVWVHTTIGKILLASLYIIWIAVEIEARGVAKRRETTA